MNPPSSLNFSRRDALALILLAGLVALFFWRILTPNPADRAQFPPGDFTDQFYEFRVYEARAFAAGRLPLWSENFDSGHPFLADVQAAVYYPIGLANTLINVALWGSNFSLLALELEALLHFWLAGAFTYLFARRVIGARVGALAAAIIFTFGGYLTSYPSLQLAILETATWLPLALFFLDRAGLEPQRRLSSTIYAGLVLGVAALAGHPQTFLFVLATSAIYFAYRLETTTANRRSIGWLGLAALVALGVAAAQLLPSLEYQQLSTRQPLSFSQAAAGFPTLDLLQIILPGFTSAFASPLYVGVLPLWLALFALLKRRRERTFWGLLALVALILSLGFYVFAYAALYVLLPGAALFREQERLAFVVSFALALLAGFGLEDLIGIFAQPLPLSPSSPLRFEDLRLAKGARRLFVLLPAGAVVALSLLLVFFTAGAQQSSGRLSFLGDRAGLILLLFALASVLVGVYLWSWIPARVFTVLALALIAFDLFSVNEPANKAAPLERYPQDGLIDQIHQDRALFRVALEGPLPGHMGIAYGLEEIGGISPLRLARYDELLQLDPARYNALLNVKYLYTDRAQVQDATRLAQDGAYSLWRVNDPLPRAWLVGQASVALDDAQALQTLNNGLDVRSSAVVALPLPFPLGQAPDPGQVTLVTHEPERLVFDVNTPADSLLVVSENYYPGWSARIDGAPVEILRVDVSLRAVPLRAGTHRVEFIFDPLSVKLGLGISLLTLLLCAGAIGGQQLKSSVNRKRMMYAKMSWITRCGRNKAQRSLI